MDEQTAGQRTADVVPRDLENESVLRPAKSRAQVTDARTTRPSFVFLVPWELRVPGGVNEVIANLHRQVATDGAFEPLILVNRWSMRRPTAEIVDGRRTIYFRVSPP